MKTQFVILIVLFFTFMNYQIIVAQDTNIQQIKYSDVLEGVLPNAKSEVEFDFTGTAGDIIIAEVMTNDVLNGLQPQLQLLNDRGTTLASTSDISGGLENFDTFRSIIPIELPADGNYAILVTDGQFQGAQPNAKFTLRLLQPEILEPGKVISDSTSKAVNSYYVVISKTKFKIEYHKTGGENAPAVNIDRIENGSLERLSTAYGADLNDVVMGVTPNRDSLHLITITRSPFDIDLFGNKTVEFTLELLTS